jgi:hypothetical protein
METGLMLNARPLRRAFLFGIGTSVLLPLSGWAMWARMSDEDLMASSELVVLGEWIGQSLLILPDGARPVTVGGIAVSETLKGPAGTGLALVAIASAEALRSGDDLSFRRGDSGLWLLRPRPGPIRGLYLADHPQRFIRASTGPKEIDALRRRLLPR